MVDYDLETTNQLVEWCTENNILYPVSEPLNGWPKSNQTLDEVKVFVKLNVERPAAEELYDEMEAHLLILLESVLERNSSDNVLKRILTPRALQEFLRDKFHFSLIDVQKVETFSDPLTLTYSLLVKAIVANHWAIKYGKGSEDADIERTIKFLQHSEGTIGSTKIVTTTINGEEVNPLIGSLCYDNLAGRMKLWDGEQWLAA